MCSRLSPVFVALLLAACESAPPPLVPAGQWSAPEANLFVTASGTILELSCREAALPGNLALDARGRFALDTTVATYGITVSYYPATIAGRLDGGTLALTVTPHTPGGTAESYLLRHRSAPSLPRCG